MKTFKEIQLPELLSRRLDSMGFHTPTSIQAQTIPHVHQGKDVLATAQTGTGKTAAFAIPLAANLINNPRAQVIVLTPTRELAGQVLRVFQELLQEHTSIKTALIIGGEDMQKQFAQLKKQPRVIVGTPGRINDHLRRDTLKLNSITALVLDEIDLMLDMGFEEQIATIIAKLPKDRQTLMFSATLPSKIEGMAARYLKSPVRVSVGKPSTVSSSITQKTIQTTSDNKYPTFIQELHDRLGSVIVFVKTKRGADKLCLGLNKDGFKAGALHGNLRQTKRDRILNAFRKEQYRILVATDVAARGIDVPHIKHVINYDLPQCAEDFIHRIGRTGRAGKTGEALSFIGAQDYKKWRLIEQLLGITAPLKSPASLRRNPGTKSPKIRGDVRSTPAAKPGAPKKKLGFAKKMDRPFHKGKSSKNTTLSLPKKKRRKREG